MGGLWALLVEALGLFTLCTQWEVTPLLATRGKTGERRKCRVLLPGEPQHLFSGSLSQKNRPSVRRAYRSAHKGIPGILINKCTRSPSGEKFGLLYGVPLRSQSMRVLGSIYGAVSFVAGAKEDL